MRCASVFGILCFGVTSLACTAGSSTMDDMIDAIRADTRLTRHSTGRDEIDARVLDAMREVAREEFVPPGSKIYAYENRPLGIGHGQTISQPFIVALMTDLLDLEPGDKVLEIGTGSGYQAAVLARLVDAVYTIEIVPELAEDAAERLGRLGYRNVEVKTGDGWYGWPEAAPFDAIIVTAVGEEIPPDLLAQLAPGGRMVLPLGSPGAGQNLTVVGKATDGEVTQRHVLAVQFVPLTGNH